MNCGYLYKTINWLLETEKRYFRLVDMRCVERMPLPFLTFTTCFGLTWLDRKGIFVQAQLAQTWPEKGRDKLQTSVANEDLGALNQGKREKIARDFQKTIFNF